MNPPYRVAIAVPCETECKTFFAYDLAQLVGYTHGNLGEVELPMLFEEGTLIATQRQGLVLRAQRIGCTHILWLDSDMRFPRNALEFLLARNKPIVGCNYAARRHPHPPTAFSEIVEGPPATAERLYTHAESEGLESAAAVGFGVCLTQVSVFDKVEQPWFAVGYSPGDEGYQGEDIFFALRARKAGFDIWVDHELSKLVRHIGSMEFAVSDSVVMKEQAQP